MTVLDLPLDQITARAREIRFWRTVLTGIGWILYGTGWLIAKAFAVAWLAITWSYAAARLGWEDARRPVPVPQPASPPDV